MSRSSPPVFYHSAHTQMRGNEREARDRKKFRNVSKNGQVLFEAAAEHFFLSRKIKSRKSEDEIE